MSWYKEWFDSPLYERIYADRDETEARRLVDWLYGVIPPEQYRRVLDLGCGRGRHALNLAEKNYDVLGVDLSESAIKKARQIKKRRNLEKVSFKVGDMREKISREFDAVVNLFTSFGYFETDQENEKIVDNVSSMLREEGVFVLDYFNSNKVREEYKPHEVGRVEDIVYEIERYVENGAICKEIHFKGEGTNDNSTYKERVKLYDLSWFKKVFSDHQLELLQVYGDYDGSLYDSSESPRLILIAERK